tara:strand:+ start:1904 stop:2506 length:603 start_codon:yes stop_codon:yes gene_type:complete
MAGKLGLNRLEALVEQLDRDLNLASTTLTNPTITTNQVATFSSGILNSNITEQSGTAAEDLTATASDLVWYANTAQAANITLPDATAANAGMKIRIIVGTTSWSTTAFKLGFANSGTCVLVGQLYLSTLDGNDVEGFTITANAQSLQIDADDATAAGGAIGSMYEFTYLEANLVHCMAYGMATTGTAAPDAGASTTTGTS